MKKLFLIFTFMGILGLSSSCSNPDDSGTGTNQGDIIGQWYTVEYYQVDGEIGPGGNIIPGDKYISHEIYDIHQDYCNCLSVEMNVKNIRYSISIDDNGYIQGITESEWNRNVDSYRQEFEVLNSDTFMWDNDEDEIIKYHFIDENTMEWSGSPMGNAHSKITLRRVKGFASSL